MALAPHQLLRPIVRYDQPIFEMVPKSCIPTDEDKDFEYIAAAFTRPITDELMTGFDLVLVQFTLQDPEALYMMFCYLQHLIGTEFAVKKHQTTSWVAGNTLFKVSNFGALTFASSNEPVLSFHTTKNDEQGLAKDYDLLVAQAVSLRRFYPKASNVACFVVTVHGQYLHISTASISRKLIDTVWETGKPPSDPTVVKRSPKYDLMVREDRKEVARSLLALFRYTRSQGEGSEYKQKQ